MDDLVGRTLGRYEITALIGRGGMATVYKARHPGLNHTVAIKVLHRHLAADSSFIGRFRREARAVAALRHPNIVRVHDFDNEGDIYFIAMEFIDGPTVATFLKRLSRQGRRLSPQEVLRLFSPLCSAIDYAHQRGMVHRDIKPSNIILTREQEPILTDYGIARIAGATAYTIPGVVMGSAHYMSPEQAEGLPGDNRSDIYSLGIVLFEVLTGSVPFQGETPMSVAIKHISATPPPALSLNPDLPPAIEAVLNKALAKDPNDRYQQGRDLALALQEIFGQAAAEPAAAATKPTTVEEPTVKVTRRITPPPPSAGQPSRVVEPSVVTEAGLTIPPAPVRRRRAGLSGGLPPLVRLAAVAAAVATLVVPLIVVGAVLLNEENGKTAAPTVTAAGSVQPAVRQTSPAAPTVVAQATPFSPAEATAESPTPQATPQPTLGGDSPMPTAIPSSPAEATAESPTPQTTPQPPVVGGPPAATAPIPDPGVWSGWASASWRDPESFLLEFEVSEDQRTVTLLNFKWTGTYFYAGGEEDIIVTGPEVPVSTAVVWGGKYNGFVMQTELGELRGWFTSATTADGTAHFETVIESRDYVGGYDWTATLQ